MDPDRLRAYNLTITDVFNAVRQQNLELPGGSLNAGAKEFTVRTTGKIIDAAQFNQIAIVNRNGYMVKVTDIGYAEDSYEEPRTRRAPRWHAGGDAGGVQAIRREHRRHRNRGQAAFERDHGAAAERRPHRSGQRSIDLH